MSRCSACDHELPATHEPGTPCPQCGATTADVVPPRRPSRAVAYAVLGAVMAAVVAVIAVIVMQRQPVAKGERLEGVELTITSSKVGVPFTVDGAPAGRTPQSLKIKGRTRPIEIKGNGVTKIVTPDHDQTINLAP
jgi:hypothetical protein